MIVRVDCEFLAEEKDREEEVEQGVEFSSGRHASWFSVWSNPFSHLGGGDLEFYNQFEILAIFDLEVKRGRGVSRCRNLEEVASRQQAVRSEEALCVGSQVLSAFLIFKGFELGP